MAETLEGVRMYDKDRRIAGYDPTFSRWRDAAGRFTTREDAEAMPVFGGRYIAIPNQARASEAAEQLEYLMGGLDPRQLRMAERATDPMPGAILAMMRLAEFYTRTEGDVFQALELPLDIALKPLEFQSPDKSYQRELEELYSERNIDVHQWLYYIWLCSSIYGQAYPLEVWGDSPEATRIVLVPPKNVEVGRSFNLGGGLGIMPPDGSEQWTMDLVESAFPKMVYQRYVEDWNEQVARGSNILIPEDYCFPVREKSLPFQRYAVPPLARASRALSTRRIFEEMRRATVEGHRNQLWLFLLGDAENRPLPEEVEYLSDQVEGMYGERTGVLVWTGDLKVEVIAPQAPDTLMANETYVGLTMEVFRKLGVSLKVVSGERGPLGGAGDTGDLDMDIGILLERLTFKVNQMYRWERRFRRKLAERMGAAAVKADKDTVVHFGRINMEVRQQIKERLLPSFQAGPMSVQTYLQEAGYDYEVELERKKDGKEDRELFAPPASFAQTVVNREGAELKRTEQSPSPGRPPNQNKQEKPRDVLKASAPSFDAYVTEVYDAYDAMSASGDVLSFIAQLKDTNARWMMDFAADGYASSGGAFQVPREWVNQAVAFVNSFADEFGNRLAGIIGDPNALADRRWNAYLYPQEGRHLAYMYGVQWAMRERGALGWKRILHPELSSTGPCKDCIADSRLMHPIEEGFFEFHPHGVCSVQGVAYYTSPTEIPIEVPVPRKEFDPGHILEFLKQIGKSISKKVEQIVRRVRG